ncbi:MAG: hypothetical protein QNJ07_07695 [Woeseiaceae bacterium]|nr:hypothetical protein [Woeseiaceae bacterium]
MKTSTLTLAALLLAGCGGSEVEPAPEPEPETRPEVTAPQVSFKPAPTNQGKTVKIGAPFRLQYKVIGTPVVGSQVPIELRIYSTLEPQPVKISYSMNDTTAMSFPKAQPEFVKMTRRADEGYIEQMVTVIPQREGRLYLNVTASIETPEGSRSMVMAVPVQVGTGTRQLEEHGELGTDEEGEAIKSLPGKEN